MTLPWIYTVPMVREHLEKQGVIFLDDGTMEIGDGPIFDRLWAAWLEKEKNSAVADGA